jgi:hypothetical protein
VNREIAAMEMAPGALGHNALHGGVTNGFRSQNLPH